MRDKLYFFTESTVFKKILKRSSFLTNDFDVYNCCSILDLEEQYHRGKKNILISFGLGQIIPEVILTKFDLAINIHGAHPDYPGRDPHHYAVYDKVIKYGAVAHLMEKSVDSGEIIDLELVDVQPGINSAQLLDVANNCAYILIERVLSKIYKSEKLTTLPVKWGKRKTKRSDLLSMCKISTADSSEDVQKKYNAFQDGISHKNLYVDLHGLRFRFENKLEQNNLDADFTFDKYRDYIKSIKKQYNFINFFDADLCCQPSVIMRHDVDMSVHNAYELAIIEHQNNIKSTYFFMLRSWFYDVRDPDIHKLITKIIGLGHEVGLHYDFEYIPCGEVSTFEDFISSLSSQKLELENILKIDIQQYSMHMPTSIDQKLLLQIKSDNCHLGMVNAYNNSLMEKFKYCSDSNGVWRFDKLNDLIDHVQYPYLYILIHPEWWTEYSLTPRQKVERAIQGRARATLKKFDDLMVEYGRPYY